MLSLRDLIFGSQPSQPSQPTEGFDDNNLESNELGDKAEPSSSDENDSVDGAGKPKAKQPPRHTK